MKSKVSDETSQSSCRLDTWLWASRFYKSRKIATEAIKGGHVSLNGQKGKPGKNVKIQDLLAIKKHQLHYHITIQKLSNKRLGAPLAQQLYLESEQSKSAREEQTLMDKQLRSSLIYDRRKPNKRDRQDMLKLKLQHPDE